MFLKVVEHFSSCDLGESVHYGTTFYFIFYLGKYLYGSDHHPINIDVDFATEPHETLFEMEFE